MASIKDIDLAYNTACKKGAKEVILLYCVSNYPAKNSDFNLKYRIFKKRYMCRVGFSDHSIDNSIAKAALAAGAEIIEKHIALQNVKGPDYKFSLKGDELKDYTSELKKTSNLFGKLQFKHSSSQSNYKKLQKVDIYIKTNSKRRKIYSSKYFNCKTRLWLIPKYFKEIINQKCPYKIKKNSKIPKNIIKKLKVSHI